MNNHLFLLGYWEVVGMRWIPQDVEVYLESKEFVDTAVVPLIPITFNQEMRQAAAMAEFTHLLTMQLEKAFKGRLLLLPEFTYLKEIEDEWLINNLESWENNLFSNGFNHIFYVTSDVHWKSHEKNLTGSLLWLPVVSFGGMTESEKVSIVDEHVKQLFSLFIQKWRQKE